MVDADTHDAQSCPGPCQPDHGMGYKKCCNAPAQALKVRELRAVVRSTPWLQQFYRCTGASQVVTGHAPQSPGPDGGTSNHLQRTYSPRAAHVAADPPSPAGTRPPGERGK